ncbi:hypothetical protein diail_8134 [Diaporthe ilicicola]|nr:hypothetical protein diail_8134 [Diaporthe ilicicola]
MIFRDSDFTELGGDPAKAIKLVSLARNAGLHASVPLADIDRHPKLQDLSTALHEREQDLEEMAYEPFDAIEVLDNRWREDYCEIRSKAAQAQHMKIDDIEDIIPATDLQASCVAFSTFASRHSGVNWLLCDFAFPHPVEEVKKLCETWTVRHAIFRTGFLANRGALYQVVSRSSSFWPPMRCHLQVYDIHGATKMLMDEDRKRDVDMRKPQTAFEILAHGFGVKRLMIRLCAAQYDGHSVAILGDEARKLLCGNKRVLNLMEGSYSAYLYHSRNLQSSQASGMPTFQNFVDGVLMRPVETRLLDLDRSSLSDSSSSSSSSVKGHTATTRATVVKTAWALALAELTGQDDILFGATAWGRNAAVPFAHDVVGCCSSHVPVRARVGMFDTYAELLGDLQAQHVESMRFEMLGANTIVRECTDWPRWARLSSLVVFQGLDIDGEGQKAKKDADSQESLAEIVGDAKFTEIMDPGDRADVILHVEPFGRETRILMAFSKRGVPETTAQAMMDSFERYLRLMSQSPAKSIRFRDIVSPLSRTAEPHICDICEKKTGAPENDMVAKQLVRSAWTNISGVDDVEFEKCIAAQKVFLEIWGNPVSAAGIARHFKESGLAVTTEEVLGCPSAEDQISLVSRKIKYFQQY